MAHGGNGDRSLAGALRFPGTAPCVRVWTDVCTRVWGCVGGCVYTHVEYVHGCVCLCAYACVCTCVHVCVHGWVCELCMYTGMVVCTCVQLSISVCVDVCAYAYMHVGVCMFFGVYVCVHTRVGSGVGVHRCGCVWVCTWVHVRAHTHKHRQTHPAGEGVPAVGTEAPPHRPADSTSPEWTRGPSRAGVAWVGATDRHPVAGPPTPTPGREDRGVPAPEGARPRMTRPWALTRGPAPACLMFSPDGYTWSGPQGARPRGRRPAAPTLPACEGVPAPHPSRANTSGPRPLG